MEITLYQIDAFTDTLFKGNPAAVVPLESWLTEAAMQQIAAENNLAETAFFVREGERFHIRWFTPSYEIDLCGHATLASAWVIFNELGYREEVIHFHSHLSGPLYAKRVGDMVQIDLPAWLPKEVSVPENAREAIGFEPLQAFKTRDIVLLLEREEQILHLDPKQEKLAGWDGLLVIVTAPGHDSDFVSRCFDPHDRIFEDPVTGSAHATLVPLWSHRLGKKQLNAVQLSERGGQLRCELAGDRVLLAGPAVKYMEGKLFVGVPDPVESKTEA